MAKRKRISTDFTTGKVTETEYDVSPETLQDEKDRDILAAFLVNERPNPHDTAEAFKAFMRRQGF